MLQPSAFAELNDADLRDTARLIGWQAAQASKGRPVVDQGEWTTITILAAAEAALANPRPRGSRVALFGYLLAKNREGIAERHFDAASRRLRQYRAGELHPEMRAALETVGAK